MIVHLKFAKAFTSCFTGSKPPSLARLRSGNSPMRPSLPAATDLSVFAGHRVLLLLDGDNLDFSLRRAGATLSYDRVLHRFRAFAGCIFPLAVLTGKPGETARDAALRRAGWRTVFVPHETVVTHAGLCVKGNADFDLAFEAGALAVVSDCTAACILTGDGDLAIAISRGLRRVRRNGIQVHTLSVSGTSSRRLRTRNDLFDSAISLGADLVHTVEN